MKLTFVVAIDPVKDISLLSLLNEDRIFSIRKELFLGRYPLWDLYGFCSFLVDPILIAFKEAISFYRAGELSLSEALKHSRQSSNRIVIQDLNCKYHMMYLGNQG